MPRAHSASSVRAKRTTKHRVSARTHESEMSYETQVIITILLLLFVYPAGLIVMWWWMKNWPLWLKIIISLPLFLGVLAFFSILLVLGTIVNRVRWDTQFQQNVRQRMWQQQMRMMTTTPTPSLPATIAPTSTSPITY